jgi:hypothetical protein
MRRGTKVTQNKRYIGTSRPRASDPNTSDVGDAVNLSPGRRVEQADPMPERASEALKQSVRWPERSQEPRA